MQFYIGNLKGLNLNVDDVYSEYAYVGGNADPEMIFDIKKGDAKGKTIFDIGAFIGVNSLLFSRIVGKNGKVLAFEPNKYNFRRVKENIKLNKVFSKNISLYPIAISNRKGSIDMFLSKNIDNGHSSTSRLLGTHPKILNKNLPNGFENVKVETIDLDSFVRNNNVVPDIIKVDVEGAEHLVLLGGYETLLKYHPTIYVEMHSEFCTLKCCEIFNSLNYTMSILKEEEDNRIMVKACPPQENKMISKTDVENLLYKIFFMYKDISDIAMSNMEKQFNCKLNEYKKLNKSYKERVLSLEQTIYKLEHRKSWKITKPLRLLSKIMK